MACVDLKKVQRREAHVAPKTQGCEECLATQGSWVHLRLCLACGHVGCCDDSPSKHASAHFHETQHPVIKSYEPEEDWAWCFLHTDGVNEIPAFPDESPAQHVSPPA